MRKLNPMSLELRECGYDVMEVAKRHGIAPSVVANTVGPYIMAEEERFRTKVVTTILHGKLNYVTAAKKFGVSKTTICAWMQSYEASLAARYIVYTEELQAKVDDQAQLIVAQQEQIESLTTQMTLMATQLTTLTTRLDTLTAPVNPFVFLDKDLRELSPEARRSLLGDIKEHHPELLEPFREAMKSLI